MSQGEYEQFQAAMEIGDHSGSLQEIINLTENLDCYDVYPDIRDHDDLGRYYIEELDAMQVPEHLRNYIDYEAYGRDIALPAEPENPLRTAEMTLEDDYGMIDGVLNNGHRGEELEKAQCEARRTTPEKKPSIRDRLAEAKRESVERKPPDKAHQKKPPEHDL